MYGPRTVHAWFKNGSCTVQERFMHGSRTVQERFMHGSRTVRGRSKYGPRTVQGWSSLLRLPNGSALTQSCYDFAFSDCIHTGTVMSEGSKDPAERLNDLADGQGYLRFCNGSTITQSCYDYGFVRCLHRAIPTFMHWAVRKRIQFIIYGTLCLLKPERLSKLLQNPRRKCPPDMNPGECIRR